MPALNEMRVTAITIIKKVIIDTINKPDYDVICSIDDKIPLYFKRLAPAMKIWRQETSRLRNEFYKNRKFVS